MGWFDEQIKLRKQSDDDAFADSFVKMAGAVMEMCIRDRYSAFELEIRYKRLQGEAYWENVDFEDVYKRQLLHKPAGYVSATEDTREKTVLDLVPKDGRRNLFPVGRLDKDTEGLRCV